MTLVLLRLPGDPVVNVLITLLRHDAASGPYLLICACLYMVARAALVCMHVAAAVIAIAAPDKRSRAERALDVLRALCRDR
jgi:hypothetical protein